MRSSSGRRRLTLVALSLVQFVLPFALNQSGSVAYVFLLGSTGTTRSA